MKPLTMKLETSAQLRNEKSRFSVHRAPPSTPGTRTRFSITSATRLIANAETK